MSGGGGALSPLGLPRPIEVRLGVDGEPRSLRRWRRHGAPGSPLAIRRVEEVWRIAEEWWRAAPLHRTYYRVLVDGGGMLTLFHDDTQPPGGGWYEQRDG